MPVSKQTLQKTADVTGAVLSQLCLVHCLLLPVLVSLLPSLTISEFFSGETFHLLVLCLATPTAIFALLQGYRNHNVSRPAFFGGAALLLLWFVFASEELVSHDLLAALNVMGGFLTAWAHWLNWSLTKEHASDCSC